MERRQLLMNAQMEIPMEKGLAMKAALALPWNKLLAIEGSYVSTMHIDCADHHH